MSLAFSFLEFLKNLPPTESSEIMKSSPQYEAISFCSFLKVGITHSETTEHLFPEFFNISDFLGDNFTLLFELSEDIIQTIKIFLYLMNSTKSFMRD